jgi:hypothetical protein
VPTYFFVINNEPAARRVSDAGLSFIDAPNR